MIVLICAGIVAFAVGFVWFVRAHTDEVMERERLGREIAAKLAQEQRDAEDARIIAKVREALDVG